MRLTLFAVPLLLLALLAPASAKPMAAPTLEGALRSPLIMLARYESCEPKGATYFGGVSATYTPLEVWKGKLPKGTKDRLAVGYAFTDGSACIAPKDWKFSSKLMPKQGATFVLFLTPAGKAYRTFRGGYGRWPADALEKSERQTLRELLSSPPAPCGRCKGKHPRQLRYHRKGMTWQTRCSPDQKPWRELTFAFEKEPAKKD
jgi:hypothetical protein